MKNFPKSGQPQVGNSNLLILNNKHKEYGFSVTHFFGQKSGKKIINPLCNLLKNINPITRKIQTYEWTRLVLR